MNQSPELITHTLVDGDILVYRASFAADNKPVKKAYDSINSMMQFIVERTLMFSTGSDVEVFLTGDNNFREKVAKTHPYKGNRENFVRPQHYFDVREYLIKNYDAQVIHDQEADDQLSIEACKRDPNKTAIASIDKDLLQVPAWHFNFTTNKFKFVKEPEGLRAFYTQMLVGDVADNIYGIYGIGKKKAAALLGDLTTEEQMYKVILDAYSGDEERIIENGRLLWMRREENEMWLPPNKRNNK